MKEAHDHHRVSPEGRATGAVMARLADAECASLANDHGEPDERCKSCAFTSGTVPNGCAQTQLDAVKAVVEGVPFMCHSHQSAAGHYTRICHGWFAVRRVINRARAAGAPLPDAAPWDFSPPDEPARGVQGMDKPGTGESNG